MLICNSVDNCYSAFINSVVQYLWCRGFVSHFVKCSIDLFPNLERFLYFQTDKAFAEKKKVEEKAMKEMAAKAAKGGPLGNII